MIIFNIPHECFLLKLFHELGCELGIGMNWDAEVVKKPDRLHIKHTSTQATRDVVYKVTSDSRNLILPVAKSALAREETVSLLKLQY